MAEREDRDPELPGDDERPDARATVGPAAGPAVDAVHERSELARWLLPSRFPADAEALLALARAEGAPEVVITDLELLPPGLPYETIGEIWRALGGEVEARTVPEPRATPIDLGDAVAEAVAEVAAEVVAEHVEDALVEAGLDVSGAELVDESVIDQAVAEAVVVAAVADSFAGAVEAAAVVEEPAAASAAALHSSTSRPGSEWSGDVHEDRPSVLVQATDLTIALIGIALMPARIGWSLVGRVLRPRRS